jgi:hypothetical protein
MTDIVVIEELRDARRRLSLDMPGQNAVILVSGAILAAGSLRVH